MARIPDAVQTLLASFSEDFAPSVWQRFLSLLTAAVMVRGRRTVWTDSTRCITYMLGNSNSRMIFDFLGIKEQHHYLSHFFRNRFVEYTTRNRKSPIDN